MFLGPDFVRLPEAVAYQVDSTDAVIPLGWFAEYDTVGVEGNIKFNLDEAQYDPELPLVLLAGPPPIAPDENTPGVCWSTYMGGDGKDILTNMETNKDGMLYVAGHSNSAEFTYPAVVGVNAYIPWRWATLSRFDENDVLAWSVFYGGNFFTYNLAMSVKQNGNPLADQIYISGSTNAGNLFLYNQAGAYNRLPPWTAGDDYYGYIAKFDYFGVIQWATAFGEAPCENGCDLSIQGSDILSSGNETYLVIGGLHVDVLPAPPSPPPSSYEIYPSNGSDNSNGFIAMFDNDDQLYWSTSIGGSLDDAVNDVEVEGQKIVVVGRTISDDMPTVSYPGGYNQSYNGENDCFVWEFNATGTHVWGTYFGGSSIDEVGGLEAFPREGESNPLGIGPNGDIFLVGNTNSQDLVIVPGVGSSDPTPGSVGFGYVVRFDNSTRQIEWSSYLGDAYFYPETVCPTSDGKLLIGALSVDGIQFTPLQYGNWYFEPEPYLNQGFSSTHSDPVILLYDGNNNFLWSTFFGGPSHHGGPEQILAFESTDTRYFVGGNHMKNSQLNSFFPLHDSGGFYDPSYNDPGVGAGDMFIAAFCRDELAIGVNENVSSEVIFFIRSKGDGVYVVDGGLENELTIWNSFGQELGHFGRTSSTEPFVIPIQNFSDGCYLVRCGNSSLKFIHHR